MMQQGTSPGHWSLVTGHWSLVTCHAIYCGTHCAHMLPGGFFLHFSDEVASPWHVKRK